MNKLRISVVKYLNTAPLVRGFTHGPLQGKYDLSFTVPSLCADALRTGAADIAIIPAIEYQRIPNLVILPRSEEHTSELQSQSNLVCRLLLEKKNTRRVPLSRPLPPVVQAPAGRSRRATFLGGPLRRSAAGILALALAACAVGPDYLRPDAAVSDAYKEATGWKVAEPQDESNRGNWWEIFGDPKLSALIESIDMSNQNVLLAEARVRQAQALAAQSRAALFPALDANASITRSHSPTGVVGGTTAGRIIDNRSVA